MGLSRVGRAVVAALCVTLALGAGLYALLSPSGPDGSATADDRPARPRAAWGVAELGGDRVVVRTVQPGRPEDDGRLYELFADGRVRHVGGDLACRRVHASQVGTGLCLRVSSNGFDYEAVVLEARYQAQTTFPVEGVPSRVRVSPDGLYGAYTTFVGEGQDYFADTDRFSTRTRIVDLRDGRSLLRLEELDVRDGARRISAESGELWGVTFAAGGRYLATLAIDDDHLLIEGRVGSRRAEVIGANVECPSLSPTGDRIAYKRRLGDSNRWRLHVRELDSGRDVALAERRSIDDQPEWFGDEYIAYSDGRDVYATLADGSGEPLRVADGASSPATLGPLQSSSLPRN